MRHHAFRLVGLLLIAAALAGCDKCSDNFLVDPFAKPATPGSCHGGPAPK